jgi:hypothetical protein
LLTLTLTLSQRLLVLLLLVSPCLGWAWKPHLLLPNCLTDLRRRHDWCVGRWEVDLVRLLLLRLLSHCGDGAGGRHPHERTWSRVLLLRLRLEVWVGWLLLLLRWWWRCCCLDSKSLRDLLLLLLRLLMARNGLHHHHAVHHPLLLLWHLRSRSRHVLPRNRHGRVGLLIKLLLLLLLILWQLVLLRRWALLLCRRVLLHRRRLDA